MAAFSNTFLTIMGCLINRRNSSDACLQMPNTAAVSKSSSATPHRCAARQTVRSPRPSWSFSFFHKPLLELVSAVSPFVFRSTRFSCKTCFNVLRNKQVWQRLQHAFCSTKFALHFSNECHLYAILTIEVTSSNKCESPRCVHKVVNRCFKDDTISSIFEDCVAKTSIRRFERYKWAVKTII